MWRHRCRANCKYRSGNILIKVARRPIRISTASLIPDEPLLEPKGIAIVLADGISSSNVSQVASESAVKSFLTDYYCTSESWSVKTSAQRVLAATNSWLHSQTRRSQYSYDKDKGYVCTLSAMVIKSTTAHHLPRRRLPDLPRLPATRWNNSPTIIASSFRRNRAISSRALGINPQIEIDYRTLARSKKAMSFVLATDGVYEHVGDPLHRQRDQGQCGRSGPGREGHRRRGLSSTAAPTISPSRSSASTNCRTAKPARSSAQPSNCRCRRCWKPG